MEPILFAFALIPVAVGLLAKFVLKWDITWAEWIAQIVLGALVLAAIWFGSRALVGYDQEVWNGAVLNKRPVTFQCPTNTSNPCRNGYDCNCYTVCTPTTDSKGNITGQSCQTYCDTCYRYPWERDWHVNTNLRRSPYLIDRIDAQGAKEPPRFTMIQPGDIVSDKRRYRNIVGAASATLFRDAESIKANYEGKLPDYPIKLYDYYRIDRVVVQGAAIPNRAEWERWLGRVNAVGGPQSHANAILVFVDAPRDYAYALRHHWRGFKQNDAVMIVGVQGGNLTWAESMSWSKNPMFDVEARNLFEAYKGQPISALSPGVVMAGYGGILKAHFQRRSMEEFEYLRSEIKPPVWLLWVMGIASVALGAGLSVFFHNFDFREGFRSSHQNHRYGRTPTRVIGRFPHNRFRR